MQDFTKQFADNSKLLTQAKQEKWLTKDRFWNFVFWFAISGGLAIGEFFRFNLKILEIASFIEQSTVIAIPLLLLIFNRTRYIKEDTFANSEGVVLTKKQMPYIMFSMDIIPVFLLSFVLAENIENIIISFIFFYSLFSGLSLYFIFKNCPISILFHSKFWWSFMDREVARVRQQYLE